MPEASVPAIMAPPVKRDNPLTRSVAGIVGMSFLTVMVLACVLSLPFTLVPRAVDGTEVLPKRQQRLSVPYDHQVREARHLPPFWAPAWGSAGGRPPRPDSPEWAEMAGRKGWTETESRAYSDDAKRYWDTAERNALVQIARERKETIDAVITAGVKPTREQVDAAQPTYWLGTDLFGRSLLIRSLVGGGISLGVGIAAATISVLLGTLWGTLAGWVGGRVDGFMMRSVDVLYGLPYILLVVLLAVAGDAVLREYDTRERERLAWVAARQNEIGEVDKQIEAIRLELAADRTPRTMSYEEEDLKRRAIKATSNQRKASDVSAVRALAVPTLATVWERQRAQEAEDQAALDSALAGVTSPAERDDIDFEHPVRKAPAAATDPDEFLKGKTVEQAVDELGGLYVDSRNLSGTKKQIFELIVLLVAIGGVSWLTMARVVRGQVLSLKHQPFIEATRAIGVPWHGVFMRHLLPNVMGPIIVYATLTVPQAILQESFLSFLGIGVRAPLPSWGNLAAEGLPELNIVDSKWWLLLFPCLLLASTLLALNFVGEGLREAFDPRRSRR